MKTLVQKLPLSDSTSFVCRTYRTPHFETPWHRHIEHEIVLIKEGHGTGLIGDYTGEFKAGDLFFISSNLPHWFRKATDELIGSGLVIQFDHAILGDAFLNLPETKRIKELLEKDICLQLQGNLREVLTPLLQRMEMAAGFEYLSLLLQTLSEISITKEYKELTRGLFHHSKENKIINEIFEHTFRNFKDDIRVEAVAEIAGMSLSTFSRFFKKITKKSYIEFLKEVRIAHARKLVQEDRYSISQIFYECGYRNISNFNRQFREIKGTTPSAFRKAFMQTQ